MAFETASGNSILRGQDHRVERSWPPLCLPLLSAKGRSSGVGAVRGLYHLRSHLFDLLVRVARVVRTFLTRTTQQSRYQNDARPDPPS